MEGKKSALEIDKFPKTYQEYLKKELEIVRELVKGRGSILDVGCGNGRAIPQIAPIVDKYTGIDIDQNIIGEAREVSNKYPNASVLVLDMLGLSKKFGEGSFDITVSLWNTINLTSDPERALKEIYKVTKEKVYFSVSAKGCLKKREEYYDSIGVSDYEIDEETETISSDVWGDVLAYSKEELKKLCEDAGFRVKEIANLPGKVSIYAILDK